jgi:tRNA nucleotidyltransferase/poly(A) polymerase
MSDYLFLLESHLDAGQGRAAAEIQRLATEAGMNVWMTGGAMRDVLRGSRILDLDFTVERDALRIGHKLAESAGGTVLAEDKLKRWVELELEGGVRASVSNARKETYSEPGKNPRIEPATIREDLLRRDFTINAIGLSLNRGSRGLLIDPCNGQADILNRELRAAHPYIFFDDPSRIFRAIRFQFTLGFEITTRLRTQLDTALEEGYAEAAPPGALAGEIRALAAGPNAVMALEEYDRCGLMKFLSPALTGAKLNAAALAKLEKIPASFPQLAAPAGWLAFLTILLQKLSAKERADALKPFSLGKEEAEALKHLDAQAKKLEAALSVSGTAKPSAIYEAMSGATPDEILMVLQGTTHRSVPDRVQAYYEKYQPMAMEITEEQVAATCVKPGTPKFDKAYKTMVAAHLNARPKKPVEPETPPVVEVPAPVQAAAARK